MLNTAVLVRLGELTNRTLVLPLVVFYPTGRCNSRCVSCDWWKADGDGELTLDEIGRCADSLRQFGTRVVLFSGGEPLLRPEVFDAAALFARHGIVLHLHTSGVLLDRCADSVARLFDQVIVSLDSADESGYRAIRGIQALRVVEQGVARLRRIRPDLPMSARTTLHRMNFRELPQLVEHAKAMSLDSISFLAADVASRAFGRRDAPDPSGLALTPDEIAEFVEVVERTIVERADDFTSGFIAEPPQKLRRLPRYYAAVAGLGPFPPVVCNAPYMSVVIEANGAVRPCFFHEPVGSVRRASLESIVRANLPAFRAALSMADDPVCQRCVCSMRSGWRSMPWA
jgi:MoaA/NifB/PqqE/SkfB family radical SAM enzyme